MEAFGDASPESMLLLGLLPVARVAPQAAGPSKEPERTTEPGGKQVRYIQAMSPLQVMPPAHTIAAPGYLVAPLN